jgi:RimJ/RimL family protein N-acetyltransferase
MTIELRSFQEDDIPRLIGWVPDARFLLQWAGPFYQYPLDRAQLLATLERTKGEQRLHYMFAAVDPALSRVVGHIELMSIDYEKRIAMLGRVLIGEADGRGKGLGKAMTAQVLDYGFNQLGLREIQLGVFDFNRAAIRCYEKLGFSQYEFRKDARQFEGEFWSLIMMKLSKDVWLELRHQHLHAE